MVELVKAHGIDVDSVVAAFVGAHRSASKETKYFIDITL